jgi:signal transduction histidine kinase
VALRGRGRPLRGDYFFFLLAAFFFFFFLAFLVFLAAFRFFFLGAAFFLVVFLRAFAMNITSFLAVIVTRRARLSKKFFDFFRSRAHAITATRRSAPVIDRQRTVLPKSIVGLSSARSRRKQRRTDQSAGGGLRARWDFT